MSMVCRNWVRTPPASVILAGQETIIGLRVPPKWLATCLVHWNGVFIACAQAEGKWLKCFGPPSSSIDLDVVLPGLGEAVEEQVLVERALEPALGARAVVAGDVDEDGVLGVGQRLHRLDHPAHLVVDVGAVAGEDLHHPGIEPLLVGVERVPGGQALGARRESASSGTTPSSFWRASVCLAVGVPARVELALEAARSTPAGTWCGEWRGAGRDVEEERPVRGDALDLAHPGDGVVGDVGGQVVVRVGRGRHQVPVLVEDGFQWFMSPALKP